MELISIIAIILLVLFISIILALSKVIGAGGNVSDLWTKPTNDLPVDSTPKKKCTSQNYRTAAGAIFSILLLYPIAYAKTHNGPVVKDHEELKLIILVALIVIEVILFLIIWIKDEKTSQK